MIGRRRGKDGVSAGFRGREDMNSCLVVGAGVMKG